MHENMHEGSSLGLTVGRGVREVHDININMLSERSVIFESFRFVQLNPKAYLSFMFAVICARCAITSLYSYVTFDNLVDFFNILFNVNIVK